jgi:hydrogenase small subunit
MTAAMPEKSPAQRLLDHLGPVEGYHDHEAIGDFGMPTRRSLEDMLGPNTTETGFAHAHLGPLKKVHAFWFAGMS